MRPKYILFAIILTSALSSCKSSKNAAETSPENIEATEASNKAEKEAQIERSIFATIHRGACFGNCPTYKMTIYSDRSVEYEGIRAVDLIGKYTSTITQKEYDQFIETAKFIEYMNLENVYDGPITDIPGTRTSIVIDGVHKEVYRRYQYPKRILKFEELFDIVMKSAKWEKILED
jgi:hypothetical protein